MLGRRKAAAFLTNQERVQIDTPKYGYNRWLAEESRDADKHLEESILAPRFHPPV